MRKAVVKFGFIALQACPGVACTVDVPAELNPFIVSGSKLLQFAAADLNGDGTQDYVVVLQGNDETGSRPLLIVTRDKSGMLTLSKRNDNIVGCESCGGVMGDPFQSLEVQGNGFTVSNAGGSIDRWANTFEFKYSRRDRTWQLTRAEAVSYSAPDPDGTLKTNVYRPPKDFGKIDISKFNPDEYLGVYPK